MRVMFMALREIGRRKLNFVLGTAAVVVAAATILCTHAFLRVYDARTKALLDRKESELRKRLADLQNEMRKATLKLSFNLAILPGRQDVRQWHERDYATAYMPEDYAARLANSDLVTVRHLLPVLQQKVKWPERKRTIILVGCRGEVPNLFKNPRRPLVQPVPKGEIVLGYELHHSLGLKVGQKVRLMGREFVVYKCHEERGSKDDITAWIPLKDAQELLGKPGLINGILALQCICVGSSAVDRIRADIAKRLPDTKVIEFGSKALARSESRIRVKRETVAAVRREKRNQMELQAQREKLASVVVPGVLAAAGLWIFLASLVNARGRRAEVAILRAIGYRASQILGLFLARSLLSGILGGVIGCGIGLLVAVRLRAEADVELFSASGLVSWGWILAALALAIGLGLAAGWIPALMASQQDPAEILREV